MIRALRRLWRYLTGDTLIDEYLAPKPESFDSASEPDEPKVYLADLVDDAADLADEANGVTKPKAGPLTNISVAYEQIITSDPGLAQFAKELDEKVIAYPPKVEEESAQAWVTAELERRTGGITRHPMDKTNYPTPPTEQDQAARRFVNREIESTYGSRPVARGYFTHGYSMRYLGELLARAKRKDPTLTDEELMGLRARGLI